MKSQGFTIIELLVVIAVITVLPVIVFSNFPQVKLQFALNRTAYAFLQEARKAQDLSLSAPTYKDSFGIEQPVAGYGIYLDAPSASNKKYLLYADRTPGNHQYDPSDYIIETVDIGASEPGVIIKNVGNVFGGKTSINFSSPDAGVTISQLDKSASNVEVVFGLESDPAKTKSVSVNISGLIEIK